MNEDKALKVEINEDNEKAQIEKFLELEIEGDYVEVPYGELKKLIKAEATLETVIAFCKHCKYDSEVTKLLEAIGGFKKEGAM